MDLNLDAQTAVTAAAGVGSANWGAQQYLDFNVITELLGSSPELGYLAFGAAGVLLLTETFDVTDVLDDG